MAKNKTKHTVNIKNKKASFNYELLDKFVAGLVLTGTEIKSIRESKASLTDAYCQVERQEVWVKNLYVAEYFYGSYNNHEARRDRKLLLSRREIRKLEAALKNNGQTLIPTRLFVNDKGLAKLEIALARGKKKYDKRASLKEKDLRREIDSARKIAY